MEKIIMVILVVLLMAVEHYLPWESILHGRKLPRLAAYIMGTLGLVLPLTWEYGRNYLQNDNQYALEAASDLWLVVIAGGVTVILIWLLDGWLTFSLKAEEGEERESTLMGKINEQKDK